MRHRVSSCGVVTPNSTANVPKISWRHFGALFAGALCIAFAPIFVVLAKRTGGVGMIDAAFWRVALGAIALGWFVIPSGRALGNRRGGWMWLWLPGVFFAGDFALWHASFDHTSVANSTLLANVSLVLVTLYAWWFWKEKITRRFLIGAMLAGAGAFFLIHSSSGRGEIVEGGNPVLGDFLALATAFFYASYLLSTKRFRRDHPAPRLIFWSSSIAALVLLPFAWFHPAPFWPDRPLGWLPLIGVGVISHAGGQGLIAYGLAGVPASLAAISLLIQPVCVAVLGKFLLGQDLVPWQITGGTLVIFGLVLAIRGQIPDRKRPDGAG